MKKTICSLMLILAFSLAALGQITISGRVTNSVTGYGVSGATVTYSSCIFEVDPPNCGLFSTGTDYTSSFGYFTIPNTWWAGSSNVLVISKKNYVSQSLILSNSDSVYVEVSLVPSS